MSKKQQRDELVSKFLGPDGKFVIDENLSEETKTMLNFFNENNINYSGLKEDNNQNIELEEDEPVVQAEPDDSDIDYDSDYVDVDPLDLEDDDEQNVNDVFADL